MGRPSPEQIHKINPPSTTEVEVSKRNDIIKQDRKYKLITPLFGGGVQPGVNDNVTPISGKAIRGHLRFWWRATRGNRFADLKSLLDFEGNLFGAASSEKNTKSSLVKVETLVTKEEEDDAPYEVFNNTDGKPQTRSRRGTKVALYAAYPLQPSSSDPAYNANMRTKSVRFGVEFILTISFPTKYREDLESALWAWETFGGIGARTRRGFGALLLESIDGNTVHRPETVASLDAVRSTIDGQLRHFVGIGDGIDTVPHLSQESIYELTAFDADAQRLWRYLIDRLGKFRQQRNPPRVENRNGRKISIPGRSKWNEPEAIRGLTKQRLTKHEPIEPSFVKFPRAAFGLPIAFQFKDRDRDRPLNMARDPRKTLLKLSYSERLASPIILRPIAVSNTQYAGVALILEGTLFPEQMKLVLRNDEERDKEKVADNLRADLDGSEAQMIMRTGNRDRLLTSTDVLTSFLDFLNMKDEI